MEDNHKLYLYPVWLRIWHGMNALLFITLIVTGISMQYASTEYSSWLSFDKSVRIHNICGIILTINYFFFILGNILSGNFKHYKVTYRGLKERLMKQFRYYTFGIFRKQNPPFPVTKEMKFNPLQQFTYAVIMYICVPVILITGFGMLFPQVLADRVFGFPGLFLNDTIHVIMGYVGSMFMIIHVYFCTIGAKFYTNFKSIINGWHEPH